MKVQLESSIGEETLDDSLSEFRTPSIENTFVSEIPSACEMEEGIVVAPGEGKKPVSILNDKFCEELGHPHLFPTGKYGHKVEREVPLLQVNILIKGCYTTLKSLLQTMVIYFLHTLFHRKFNLAVRLI